MLRDGAVSYAFRSAGVRAGAALNVAQARKMGERIEARRVLWGYYRRDGREWQAGMRVLNVATGEASPERSASAADWFDARDVLAPQLLRDLGASPPRGQDAHTPAVHRTSPAALEWFSRAYAMQFGKRDMGEMEQRAREALAADPQFAEAHIALASVLGSEGKLAEAEKAARRALELRPTSAARSTLAFCLMHQGKADEAEQEMRRACKLDPDDPVAPDFLGQIYRVQGKLDEAIAILGQACRLDPTDGSARAVLALAYLGKRDRARGLDELKEAERLAADDVNAEQMICQAYDALAEVPQAVAHYERFVALARKEGVRPDMVSSLEERGRQLKATLTPTPVAATEPRAYTGETLQAELGRRLAPGELEQVVNPLAGSPEIRRWAEELAVGAGSDVEKARRLFDALVRRLPGQGEGGARTAQQVFAAWAKPEEPLSCQEYARLFVAMARSVGLRAFYVHLERDFQGKAVYHDCAVLFDGGKALLVDPAYRWFGVPHKQFQVLDDVQSVAHHLFQPTGTREDVGRFRLAAKLDPGSAWGRMHLAQALVAAEQWEEARQALAAALKLEPERWDACEVQAALAAHDGKLEEAAGHLRRALALNPESADAHCNLGQVLRAQGRLKDAGEEFRKALRYNPSADTAEKARSAIVQIEEELARPPAGQRH